MDLPLKWFGGEAGLAGDVNITGGTGWTAGMPRGPWAKVAYPPRWRLILLQVVEATAVCSQAIHAGTSVCPRKRPTGDSSPLRRIMK